MVLEFSKNSLSLYLMSYLNVYHRKLLKYAQLPNRYCQLFNTL